MVISPRPRLEVFVAQDGSNGGNAINRGDYSHFPFGDQTSCWDTLPLPHALTSTDTQDAGNIFLVATRKDCGICYLTKWPHFDHYIWPHPNR